MDNPSRRRALFAGLAGTALALVGQPASASTPPSEPDDTTGTGDTSGTEDTSAAGGTPAGTTDESGTVADNAPTGTDMTDASSPTSGSTPASTTTTTEQPARPTPDDVALLGDAQRLELAAVELYATALAAGAAGDEDRVLQTLQENHRAYADAFSGMLGRSAPNEASQSLLDSWSGRFDSTSLTDVAAAAYELESSFVQTYVGMSGELQGSDGLVAAASILTVGSRACVVLADLGGQGDDLDAVLDTAAPALEA